MKEPVPTPGHLGEPQTETHQETFGAIVLSVIEEQQASVGDISQSGTSECDVLQKRTLAWMKARQNAAMQREMPRAPTAIELEKLKATEAARSAKKEFEREIARQKRRKAILEWKEKFERIVQQSSREFRIRALLRKYFPNADNASLQNMERMLSSDPDATFISLGAEERRGLISRWNRILDDSAILSALLPLLDVRG